VLSQGHDPAPSSLRVPQCFALPDVPVITAYSFDWPPNCLPRKRVSL
jgi:hypothetical protein